MKKQINLYQPSCYPKREKATFRQLTLLTVFCVFTALLLQFILNKQRANIQEAAEQHRALLTVKQNELLTLQNKMQNNHAPDAKIREQLALQRDVQTKQRLLGNLAGIEVANVVSFSELLRGLSLAHINSISINSFSIIDGRLNIAGQAEKSDSVPLWLTKIQKTDELAGVAFQTLKISENAGGFYFQLTNGAENKAAKGLLP